MAITLTEAAISANATLLQDAIGTIAEEHQGLTAHNA